ncbi:hypothetical protein Tco_0680823 [Tanacetum coccineum]|uniref:Integrase, catalytic region, zinc finger, CCHC-type, peptidase aspartic, catalytic n=1 Tax=Tanacetum coccineum TaxID=301880 RepID=A0ABQ4XLK5_9ASTR
MLTLCYEYLTLLGYTKDQSYTSFNHYTDAKDIWDNVKMILEGSELTKDDRESQLYDEFERFCQIKGETIHVYYVRFSKLINDMRNIKMTMSRMQLNSKFVNNMLPEWSRFITEVKLNREEQCQEENVFSLEMLEHENVPQLKRPRDSDYFKDKMLLMNAHENGAVLDEEQLLFLAGEQITNFDEDVDDLALNVDHIFEADQCNAFDSDVDEAPTTQTMFMANLTSKEAGPSY